MVIPFFSVTFIGQWNRCLYPLIFVNWVEVKLKFVIFGNSSRAD
jgi:hypothetical protein